MSISRRIFRKYAQSKGLEAKSFVKIKKEMFEYSDILITMDSKGGLERTSLDYEQVLFWVIKNKKDLF